jgi:hypothetical protein
MTWCVIGYAAVVAAAVWGAAEARRRVLASLDTPQARAEWQAWRKETERLSEEQGPMKRRPAKAVEPPLLILLRDHFPAAVTSAIVSVSILYWLLVVLVRGSLRTPAPLTADAEAAAQ